MLDIVGNAPLISALAVGLIWAFVPVLLCAFSKLQARANRKD